MRKLIYLSPLPWQSFAQRPHKFVTWFLKKYGGEVLWIEPYPTRFPLLSDLKRVGVKAPTVPSVIPDGLTIISLANLPIEPLPGSGMANGIVWRKALKQAIEFAADGYCTLVVGKPSVFARQLMQAAPQCHSIYDAMDDFPAFYHGFSQRAMMKREESIVSIADEVWTSSTHLYDKWNQNHNSVRLVYNGLDADVLRPISLRQISAEYKIFGYLGTVGNWFDWAMVISLAHSVPDDLIRIIGPIYHPAPEQLPANIQILPPCDHTQAMLEMAQFDVGLIPFLRNALTNSVDPIKYYEYRAYKIPVISSDFGEMHYRGNADGVFLYRDGASIESLVESVGKEISPKHLDTDFVHLNSWAARFDLSGL